MKTITYFLLLFRISTVQGKNTESLFPTLVDSVPLSFFKSPPLLKWKKDPFLREAGLFVIDTNPIQYPNLEAILYTQKNPVAIVNGSVVSVGDLVDRKYVKKIGKNFVLLEEEDSLIELSLPSPAEEKGKLEIKEHKK